MTLTPESVGKYAGRFETILADPPWRFANRTGKMAPEHKRLHRYETMSIEEILCPSDLTNCRREVTPVFVVP